MCFLPKQCDVVRFLRVGWRRFSEQSVDGVWGGWVRPDVGCFPQICSCSITTVAMCLQWASLMGEAAGEEGRGSIWKPLFATSAPV